MNALAIQPTWRETIIGNTYRLPIGLLSNALSSLCKLCMGRRCVQMLVFSLENRAPILFECSISKAMFEPSFIAIQFHSESQKEREGKKALNVRTGFYRIALLESRLLHHSNGEDRVQVMRFLTYPLPRYYPLIGPSCVGKCLLPGDKCLSVVLLKRVLRRLQNILNRYTASCLPLAF